ncbi:MAG: hypothetical protein QXN01_04590 [Candidatus Anstonellales archaeon]
MIQINCRALLAWACLVFARRNASKARPPYFSPLLRGEDDGKERGCTLPKRSEGNVQGRGRGGGGCGEPTAS